MAKAFCASGRVLAGTLYIRNKKEMDGAFRGWKDGEVTITIERAHATRSTAQNAYYWSVVIPRVQEAFKKEGITAGDDPNLTNEVLKAQFMDPRLVNEGRIRGFLSDTGLLIGTHTRDLNKLEFIEYLDRICDHAAEYWKTYITPPDPLWREHAEREQPTVDPRATMRREKGQAA